MDFSLEVGWSEHRACSTEIWCCAVRLDRPPLDRRRWTLCFGHARSDVDDDEGFAPTFRNALVCMRTRLAVGVPEVSFGIHHSLIGRLGDFRLTPESELGTEQAKIAIIN